MYEINISKRIRGKEKFSYRTGVKWNIRQERPTTLAQARLTRTIITS